MSKLALFRLENIIKDKYKYEMYIQNEKCALYIILKTYNLMLIFILIINYFLKHFFRIYEVLE